MTFWNIISSVILGPLELIFDAVFTIANRIIGNPGLSIIALSLTMNILVLPLYRRADAMQEEEKDIEMKLQRGVDHIKKTFKGDEKMMMLQTYYRQNNYKPAYVLRGAVSLLLQIPFFIAAYNFLSKLELLNGVSFGPISNLGAPDGILKIAGFSINALPIIMTAVNLISCVIFTKGSTLKSKIQLYAMAVFFLFFLYTSPSGLVFYWTLNNVFSLVKTIFYKVKNPKLTLAVFLSACGVAAGATAILFRNHLTLSRLVFLIVLTVGLQIPTLKYFIKTDRKTKVAKKELKYSKKVFTAGGIYMSVLTGILIPSAVISASPQEFVDITYYYNPLWYIAKSLCIAVGLYIVWLSVFYTLASEKSKAVFDKVVWIMCGCATVEYMFFDKNLGNLTSALKYENGLSYTPLQITVNTVVLVLAAIAMYFIFRYLTKITSYALIISSVAFCIMSAMNISTIKASIKEITVNTESGDDVIPHHNLSKNGKNVVILMVDRAMGMYVPYIFNELPEVQKQFDGFTYYSNTVSFGTNTNFCTPALFGGYEYTPVELNKRNTESLKDKQNESLKVLPVLFGNEGYDVTVFDPPYANYEWIPDLSIYDAYPYIKAYNTKGVFLDEETKSINREKTLRDFFCYSILRTSPTLLHPTLYDYGSYNSSKNESQAGIYSGQQAFDTYTSKGIDPSFLSSYSVLDSLDEIMPVKESDTNTFAMLDNETTHSPIILKEPEYVPAAYVDNNGYESEHQDRLTVNGMTLKMDNATQAAHYQTNAAVLIKLGEWFDYLREEGVYDNTKIIIVSDHGGYISQLDELNYSENIDAEGMFPLFMVKDFNASGFVTSDEFMTNADVPTLALKDVIKNPVNPFTGNPITDSEKTAHDQYCVSYGEWDIEKNFGNTFAECTWVKVHDNIWDKSNWKYLGGSKIIDSYDK